MIAERAGVSRGAQLHHYPTKADLVAAAVEHLATKLIDQFGSALAETSESDRIEFILDAMWSSFSAPLLTAWVELSVAARTDADVRARLASVSDHLRDTVLGRAGPRPEVLLVITMTLLLLEGVTLHQDLRPVVFDTWKQMVRTAFPNL